jgi:hypothetical protein
LRRPFPDEPANWFVTFAADIVNLIASSQSKSCVGLRPTWFAVDHAYLLINGVNKSERFLVRQSRLLHLIHHLAKTDFVDRIGESVAATGARISATILGK